MLGDKVVSLGNLSKIGLFSCGLVLLSTSSITVLYQLDSLSSIKLVSHPFASPYADKEIEDNPNYGGFKYAFFSNTREERALRNIWDKHRSAIWCRFYVKRGNEVKSLSEIHKMSSENQKVWIRDASRGIRSVGDGRINNACWEAKFGRKVAIEVKNEKEVEIHVIANGSSFWHSWAKLNK